MLALVTHRVEMRPEPCVHMQVEEETRSLPEVKVQMPQGKDCQNKSRLVAHDVHSGLESKSSWSTWLLVAGFLSDAWIGLRRV